MQSLYLNQPGVGLELSSTPIWLYLIFPLVWFLACIFADRTRQGSLNLSSNCLLLLVSWVIIPLLWSLAPLVWIFCLILYPILGIERIISMLIPQSKSLMAQVSELTGGQINTKPLSNKFNRRKRFPE